MKLTNWILAVLFALFAVVQYNDLDPWLWILMYGYVAVVCGFAALGKWNNYVILAGLAVSLTWGVLLVPEFVKWLKMGLPNIAGQMKAESPHIEFTREFLGLAICVATLAWQFWLSKRKR